MPKQRRVAVMMDFANPFKRHSDVLVGIHDYADERGDWHVSIDPWADHALPTSTDQPTPYDGIVGRITSLGGARAKRLALPIVNVHFNSRARGLPNVFPDPVACGRVRAEHLMARGFTNFGVLVHAGDRFTMLEREAFEQTVRGLEGPRQVQCSTINLESKKDSARMGTGALDPSNHRQWKYAMRQIDQWISGWQPPIGLFIYDVTIARIVIERITARGWRVPEDVAIIAGVNEPIQCERPAPSITSLEFPYERIGYEAARLLDDLMAEPKVRRQRQKAGGTFEAEPPSILLPPVGIVARQSTDFHAVEDELVRKALGYMDTNSHRPILIDDIAEHVDVSRATLINRFRTRLGHSINTELQRLRLERAKRELTSGDRPIYQVAHAAGFGTVRMFNVAFRKAEGCTPGEYRKRAAARIA